MLSVDEALHELLKENIEEPELIKFISLFARRMYATRTLGHWELFKQIQSVPGDIVELGVYKGETLLNFARFLEILCPGDREKVVYGFDHWQGLQNFTQKDGWHPDSGNEEGGWNPKEFKSTLLKVIDLFHRDSFVPAKARIKLIDGNIIETAPDFVKENPGVRISLLHFDCDMYEPTLAGLKAFYSRVVPGGIVLFDEYGCKNWPGETSAVEEFFGPRLPKMQKFTWQSTPGAWFVKQDGTV